MYTVLYTYGFVFLFFSAQTSALQTAARVPEDIGTTTRLKIETGEIALR